MQKESLMWNEETLPWGGSHLEELIGRIKQGASRIVTSGLQGSSLAFFAAQVGTSLPDRPILVIASDPSKAFQLYEDILFYAGETEEAQWSRITYYPADEVLPYSEMLPDRGALQARLGGLLQLHQKQSPILVMPAAALARRVIPLDSLNRHSDLLQAKEEIDRDGLIKHLVMGGYQRVPVVEDRGTFSVRGAVLDIFAPLYRYPARIELDDLRVSSIRFFDPSNQRTLDTTDHLLIGPVDELLRTPENLQIARRRFAHLADEIDFPTRELRQLIEDLSNDLRPFGSQALVPGLYESLQPLFFYLPKNTVVLFDEPRDIFAEAYAYYQRMEESFQEAQGRKALAFPPHEFVLLPNAIQASLRDFCRVEHSSTLLLDASPSMETLPSVPPPPSEASPSHTENGVSPGSSEPAHAKFATLVSQATPSSPRAEIPGTHFGPSGELIMPFAVLSQSSLKSVMRSMPIAQEHRLQPLVDRTTFWRKEGMRVAVVCGTKGQALRLKELLELYSIQSDIREEGFSLEILQRKPEKHAEMTIFLGRIADGFVWPRTRLVVISEEEIFGPKARRSKPKKKNLLQATELQSLRPGDFVIHREHGLARYGGLQTIALDNATADFLLLEYQGTDRFYLPVTKLSEIERYTGGGNPTLDRLKGHTFEKKKTKARASIQAVAGELLQLYAAREAHRGYAFPPPDENYQQFEARFPFEETPDQMKAIEDTLADMRSDRCMDRLICGDVGYGKTEVAMRAAFYAAWNGKQVAVLVPTTVLAQQHGLNFTERFEGYPLRIAVLSRFQSKAEQTDILKRLHSGNIDIIIGTHRLLSRDVHMPRLGLLIIDEEQRFGVRHKERIKQLRQDIEVLTLTATPIPRTLEMAITGVRDLSLITTAPHDRLAIRTTIAPYNDDVIREPIMRELNRGGQVFFVHNRVESIGKIQEDLQRIVPEARITVGHGQMPEEVLERVMLDFVQGRYNILLSTSIIESGLDIPRANTILVDRADTFGLAQLYQIRGRVGRGRERAYAILLVPDDQRLSAEARQRLTTLQRFSELGAGFEIARHDLEMRGAGNLLGSEQSGHIHLIGMDLYMEMLQETVAEMQGKPFRKAIEPEVKLGVDALLPEYFIPDLQLRLQCYRRLSGADSTDELDSLAKEFEDRFGYFPDEVTALFEMMEIKILLKQIFALSGEISYDKFRIFFPHDAPLAPDRLVAFAQKPSPPFRLLPNNGIESPAPLPLQPDRMPAIRHFLRSLPVQIFDEKALQARLQEAP